MSNVEYSAEHRTEPNSVNAFTGVVDYSKILSNSEKIDYLYSVALKVGALVDAITPQQIEQVKRMQSNPLISKLFAGIVKTDL
jgi:hypothetical protein